MRTIGIDCETNLIVQSGKATKLVCPEMICLSYDDGETSDVVLTDEGLEMFGEWIRDPDVELAGANVFYDLNVIINQSDDDTLGRAVYEAIEDGRIHDIQDFEKLADIRRGGIFRRGGYTLKDLTKRHLGVEMTGKSGPDVWRLRYNELKDVPVDEWPKAAYEYAHMDSVYTRAVHLKQQDKYAGEIAEEQRILQVCGGWALSLMSAWGMMTDTEFAEWIDAYYAQREDILAKTLRERGIMRDDGTVGRKEKRDLVEKAWEDVGENPILTEKGNISTAKNVLKRLLEDHRYDEPGFIALIEYNRATKFRSTYMDPILDSEGGPLCPRYNTIVNSGRTSSSGPNIQNFPSRTNPDEDEALESIPDDVSQVERIRDHGVVVGPDIRGCFVPREGKVFVSADYSALEMATLAQVMRNWTGSLTPLGQAINAGKDLHCMVAKNLAGCTYEEAYEAKEAGETWIKRPRDVAKIFNFSAPVGAATSTIRANARDQGLKIPADEAEAAHRAWDEAWPEMSMFHDFVGRFQSHRYGNYRVEQHGPNRTTTGWRVRVCEKFTEAANSMFQGPAGDLGKYTAWLLVNSTYFDENSPLYGARTVAFIHDEFVIECDADRAHACGAELSRVMVEGANVFCPDILIEADYDIHEERWSK